MKKITLLLFAIFAFAFTWQGHAQFGCGTAVVVSDGYTASGITTPGTGGVEDWNTNPVDACGTDTLYWDDDVYMFTYTAGATVEEISMTIFTRNSWNGIGIFSTCSGTDFSGCLDSTGSSSSSISKTVTATIAAGQTVYIAVGQWGTPNDLDFDVTGFSVTQITCPAPSAMVDSNLSTTAVDLTWTAGGSETSWNLEWKAGADFIPGNSEEDGFDSASVTPVYNAVGLLSNTTYYFYYQADCGGDLSAWVGPYVVTTPCEAFTAPYAQNFDAESTPDIQTCWNAIVSGSTSTYANVQSSTTQSASASNSVRFYNSSDTTGEYFLVSPNFSDFDNTKRIKFSVYQNIGGTDEGDVLEIGTMTDPTDSATYTTFQTIPYADLSEDTWVDLIINFDTYAGSDNNIAIKMTFGATYNYYYFDEFYYEDIPSCLDVTGLTLDGFSNSDVTFSWTAGGSETAWEYVVQAAGTGVPAGAGTASIATTVNETGLTPQTDYEVYVRSDCGGGDLGAWIGPLTFSTLCDPFTAPYTQNFDGTTDPAVDSCWTVIENFTNTTSERIETYNGTAPSANSAPNSVEFYNSSGNYPTDGELILVSPQFSDFGTDKRIKFMLYDETNTTSFIVGTMSDPTDPSTFTAFQTFLDADMADDVWEEHVVSFDTYVGTDQYVAFLMASANTYDYMYLDDFVYEDIPSCLDVTGLTLDGFSNSDVTFSWTAGGSEMAWEYVVQAAGTGVPAGAGTASTATTVNETGLTAQTDYEVYVRSDCGGGDLGAWIGPLTFSTLCDPVLAPYTQDFENAGFIPGCWTNDGVENWLFSDSGTGDHIGSNGTITGTTTSGGYFAWVDSSGSEANAILTSPLIDVSGLTNPALYFYELSDNEGYDNSQLDVEVWDGASWVNVAVYNTNTINNGWEQKIIDLSSLTITGNIQVRFTFTEVDSADYYDDIAIDDVKIDEAPSCYDPASLAVDALGWDSATLSWTQSGAVTSWNIEYGPAGFTQGMGTVLSGVTNPYPLNGLTSQTAYDFYVQADCGGGDLSAWVGPYSFTTTCSPFSTPFCEDFDTTATGTSTNPTIPSCWTFIDSGAGYGYVSSTGANSFYMYNSSDSSGDYILVSPPITNIADGSYRIKFDVDGTSGQELIIGTMSNPNDASTFEAIQTITLATSSYEQHAINLTAVTTTNTYVGIKHGQTGTYDSYYLDNICFEAIPTCMDLSGLGATNITDVSADLSWTDPNAATLFNIELVDITGGGSQTMTATHTGVSNPYSLSGLTPANDYEFYVQADCGGGDLSAWAGPYAFTTECIIFTPNYVEDFSVTVAPNCWSEGDNSTIASGPDGTNGSWLQDDYLNDTSNPNGKAARFNLFTTHPAGEGDWLVSPTIDLSAGSYGLFFNVGLTAYGSASPETPNLMGSDDEVQVLISSDDGATWTNLETFNASNAPSHLGEDRLYDLASYTSATTKIAFWATHGTVDDSEDVDFFIDNFRVDLYSVLSVDEVGAGNNVFTYYPNPVSNTFVIKAQKTIEHVAVYNMLGQEVLKIQPNTIDSELDVSGLSNGSYFVRVTIEGITETVRIVKQ